MCRPRRRLRSCSGGRERTRSRSSFGEVEQDRAGSGLIHAVPGLDDGGKLADRAGGCPARGAGRCIPGNARRRCSTEQHHLVGIGRALPISRRQNPALDLHRAIDAQNKSLARSLHKTVDGPQREGIKAGRRWLPENRSGRGIKRHARRQGTADEEEPSRHFTASGLKGIGARYELGSFR